MHRPVHDGLTGKVGSLEIHVGHPHRQHVRIAEHGLAEVIFHTVGIGTWNDLVEIVLHLKVVNNLCKNAKFYAKKA